MVEAVGVVSYDTVLDLQPDTLPVRGGQRTEVHDMPASGSDEGHGRRLRPQGALCTGGDRALGSDGEGDEESPPIPLSDSFIHVHACSTCTYICTYICVYMYILIHA